MRKKYLRKMFIVLLAAVLTVGICVSVGASGVPGDVNGDGKVSALDALMILQSLVGKATLTDDQKAAGNVDGVGTEPGSLDALKILQFLVGKASL